MGAVTAALRRLFRIAVIAGAAYAAWTVWRRQQSPLPAAAPEWPPMASPATSASASTAASTDTAGPGPAPEPPPAADARWVLPVDGACPAGYPVKVKTASKIHHVPGGRFYDRTAPDRCYADAAAAEADGYRAARS